MKVGAPRKRGEETAPFNIRATETVHRFTGTIAKVRGGNRTDALHWIVLATKEGGPAELRCIDLARQLDEANRTISQANRNFEKVILDRDEWRTRHKQAVGKWGDLWKAVRRHLPPDILQKLRGRAADLGLEAGIEPVPVGCRTCAERDAADLASRYRESRKESEAPAS